MLITIVLAGLGVAFTTFLFYFMFICLVLWSIFITVIPATMLTDEMAQVKMPYEVN